MDPKHEAESGLLYCNYIDMQNIRDTWVYGNVQNIITFRKTKITQASFEISRMCGYIEN